MTGICPHGCKPHWNGTRCDGRDNFKQNISLIVSLRCMIELHKAETSDRILVIHTDILKKKQNTYIFSHCIFFLI